MKKNISVFALFMLILTFCLAGCSSSNSIPDGDYLWDGNSHVYVKDDGNENGRWTVKGDKAYYYFDNWNDYRCNIVKEDDKIYFEGYLWFDLLLWKKIGREFKWEVIYDEEANSITILDEFSF